ncbi:hypothetical protein F4604DRAFT_1677404 [Suillus subluteus]|nr:hypothetical protein F4604DRAFT_1677404 [Suillus subluteus]
MDAAFYKKEISDWDVVQKLFKQEMDQYDKDEQEKLGVKNEIKRLRLHRKSGIGKALIQNHKQSSHKKTTDQTLSVIVNESKPVNSKKPFTQSSRGNNQWTLEGFEKFAEWSKLEFYLEENDNKSDEEDKDKGKASLPELILGHHGYVKLPSHAGVSSKGQQELVHQIFCASYKVFTDTVPWREVVGKPTLYLNPTSIPKGFILRDPSHMRTENVNELWAHWEARKAARKLLLIFMSGKIGDMSKKQLKMQFSTRGKLPWTKASSTTGTASACPTPHTKGPAKADTSEDESAGAAPIPHMKRPAKADTSEDELAGAPAAVSIKGHIQFLKFLSNNDKYLLLAEGIRDLGKIAESANISGFSLGMRVTVGLGLLLRVCKRAIEYEEDDVTLETLPYISSSLLNIKILDLVVDAVNKIRSRVKHLLKAKHVCQESSGAVDHMDTTADREEGGDEEMLRQKLVDELKKKKELNHRYEELKQQVEAEELHLNEVQEENSRLEKEREDNEKQVAEEEKEKDDDDDEEEEEEMKEKKRKEKNQVQWIL